MSMMTGEGSGLAAPADTSRSIARGAGRVRRRPEEVDSPKDEDEESDDGVLTLVTEECEALLLIMPCTTVLCTAKVQC